MPNYPDGPTATTSPWISSFTDPLLVGLYIFLGFYFVLLPLEVLRRWWLKPPEGPAPCAEHASPASRPQSSLMRRSVSNALWRATSKRRPSDNLELMPQDSLDPTTVLAAELRFTMRGFRKSGFERLLKYSTIVLWLVLLVIGFLLMYDAMHDCEMEGLNNMCFYGNYPVLGDATTHRKVMVAHTGAIFGVCVLFFALPAHAVTWILEPASLHLADRVYVTTNEEQQHADWMEWLTNLWERKLASRGNRLVRVHESTTGVKYVLFELKRYIIQENRFYLAGSEDASKPKLHHAALLEQARSRDHDEYVAWIETLGPNKIFMSERTSLMKEVYLETVIRQAPWNIYALYIFVWWFTDAWWAPPFIMVLCIVGTSFSNVSNALKAQATAEMILEKASTTLVLRDSQHGDHKLKTWSRVASVDIVPWDLVCIEPTADSQELPFDAVLISGSATVEEKCFGTPHRLEKHPGQPDHTPYAPTGKHAFCTLFQGSVVLPSDSPHATAALAIVTKTGINTRLGSQVWHSLQASKLTDGVIEFYSAPLLLLFVYSAAVAVVSVILLSEFKSSGKLQWYDNFGYTIYTLSQTVSPLLNLCVSRVTYWGAANRLRRHGVHARDAGNIALGVYVDFIAVTQPMDREQHSEELVGCVSAEDMWQSGVLRSSLSDLEVRSVAAFQLEHDEASHAVLRSLLAARCRSNPELGPMCTLYKERAVLQQVFLSKHSQNELAITTSHAPDQPPRTELFCQGAVSRVLELSAAIPEAAAALGSLELQLELTGYTVTGMAHAEVRNKFQAHGWVEAHATARCTPEGLASHKVQLKFGGVSVWRDPADFNSDGSIAVQPDTAEAVQVLQLGLLQTVLFSASSLGRACFAGWRSGMIEQGHRLVLGLIGAGGAVEWRQAHPPGPEHEQARVGEPVCEDTLAELLEEGQGQLSVAVTAAVLDELLGRHKQHMALLVLRRLVCLAELKQLDKQQLIDRLQDRLGLKVALCGDFSEKPCMSLCMGHRGVASFATFITEANPLAVMPTVLREGRACVASTLALFQFIVTYGLLFSITKMTGFYFRVFMTHSAYLFIDSGMLLIAVTITLSKPPQELVVERPPMSFRNWITALSLGGSMLINVLFWLLSVSLMDEEEAFVAWPLSPTSDYGSTGMSVIQDNALAEWWTLGDNWEASIMFLTFANQMISCAFAFQFGHALRDSWYTNHSFAIIWVLLTAFLYYILLAESNDLTRLFVSTGGYEPGASTVWTTYFSETGHANNAMPDDYKQQQALVMAFNTALLVGWDQLVYRCFMPCYGRASRWGSAEWHPEHAEPPAPVLESQ